MCLPLLLNLQVVLLSRCQLYHRNPRDSQSADDLRPTPLGRLHKLCESFRVHVPGLDAFTRFPKCCLHERFDFCHGPQTGTGHHGGQVRGLVKEGSLSRHFDIGWVLPSMHHHRYSRVHTSVWILLFGFLDKMCIAL